MLRGLLMILVLVVLVTIGLVYAGFITLNQTQQARAPQGGQAPAFELEVRQPEIGTTTRNVQVPVVRTETRQIQVPTVSAGGNSAQGNSQ